MKVKLSPKSSFFADITTGLKVFPNRVIEVTPKQSQSKRFKRALDTGHIIRVEDNTPVTDPKKDVENPPATEKTLLENLTSMKKAEIMVYLRENAEALDLSEETLTSLDGMKKTDILEYFTDDEDEN